MKKVLLFIAVVSAASFASCKKDRTCTCTTTSTGYSGTPVVTTYVKSTKSAARANCLNYTTTSGSTVFTTTCTLD